VSFRWKLSGALLLTALLAVGANYWLTTSGVRERFDVFRREQRHFEVETLVPFLAGYWRDNGSWAGLHIYFQIVSYVRRGTEVFQRPILDRIMVVDSEYQVVGCAEMAQVGQCVRDDPEIREIIEYSGIPVVVDGVQVATVIPLDIANLTPLERDFLSSIQRAALVAGAVALLAAALLAVILVTQLSRPLRRLILATTRIAAGDLAHRVQVRARDEIGRLGQAFNDMAAALESSEKARQNLLTDVAHELRTPLSVVRGNLEGMLDGVFPLTPEGLAPVYDQTLHLGDLVEDLRTLTLAESGHLLLAREPTDIGELARAVVEGLRPTATEDKVQIEVRAAPGLYASVDPRRIRQVLGNLLDNALRYSPPGGTITVSVTPAGSELLISVRDEGPGVGSHDLPHVFERFYQGDKSRTGNGTGLGLAIARELVQTHGGRIWVENQGGAVFTFALPALESASSVA
jgi:signal transduction histidine kinase